MTLSPLTAISPIDGRYRRVTQPLEAFFSEGALIKYRVKVEIEYFIALLDIPLPQLKGLDPTRLEAIRNIGIIARHPAIYPWLRETLTAEFVKRRFEGTCHGDVDRFEVENLGALNFLLHDSLGGGGSASLKTDAQGKTHGLAVLRLELDVPPEVLETIP